MDRFILCTRDDDGQQFIAEPGPTRYLQVPAGQLPEPRHTIKPELWFKRLRKASVWGPDARVPGRDRGDILVFVHGYNNSQDTVMQRHDRLAADLGAVGFKGVVLSFDWPSEAMAINYLEDRHDAKLTAMQLVRGGIAVLAGLQTPDCAINIHLLGHSTGAYVIREAFDDADDTRLDNNGWAVSQVAFIGGDVSSGSMSAGNASTDSLYRHCARLTNYSNLSDSVLKLSNAKRLGVAPRVGRVGLPADAPRQAVNVDCTAYFQALATDPAVMAADQTASIGSFDHSWHIGNRVFARDLFEVIKGDLDRSVIPTRSSAGNGALSLLRPAG
jgi:pimeloyl-ACP methyl ester carboxylesterase